MVKVLANLFLNYFFNHRLVVIVGLIFAGVVVKEEWRDVLKKYCVIVISEEGKGYKEVLLLVDNFPKNDKQHYSNQHIDEAKAIESW